MSAGSGSSGPLGLIVLVCHKTEPGGSTGFQPFISHNSQRTWSGRGPAIGGWQYVSVADLDSMSARLVRSHTELTSTT
jgi:hypothetical protein